MRRAALFLFPVALLVSLPPLVVAKTEQAQIYKRGLRVEAVKASLPRASTSARPRSATQPVSISIPAFASHTFLNEFYGLGAAAKAPVVPVTASTPVMPPTQDITRTD